MRCPRAWRPSSANVATCVDLYFETVAFSWNFLKSRGASARPEYETAWQLYHNGLARLMGAGQRFGRLDPSKGLRVVTAAGSLMIPTTYQGFVWQAEDFSRIEVVNSAAPASSSTTTASQDWACRWS